MPWILSNFATRAKSFLPTVETHRDGIAVGNWNFRASTAYYKLTGLTHSLVGFARENANLVRAGIVSALITPTQATPPLRNWEHAPDVSGGDDSNYHFLQTRFFTQTQTHGIPSVFLQDSSFIENLTFGDGIIFCVLLGIVIYTAKVAPRIVDFAAAERAEVKYQVPSGEIVLPPPSPNDALVVKLQEEISKILEIKTLNSNLKKKVLHLRKELEEFIKSVTCFLSQQVMTDPVTLSSGISYEKSWIALHIKNNLFCPATKMKLSEDPRNPLNTNVALKDLIETNIKQFTRRLNKIKSKLNYGEVLRFFPEESKQADSVPVKSKRRHSLK